MGRFPDANVPNEIDLYLKTVRTPDNGECVYLEMGIWYADGQRQGEIYGREGENSPPEALRHLVKGIDRYR